MNLHLHGHTHVWPAPSRTVDALPHACVCHSLSCRWGMCVQLLAHPAMEEAISDQDQDVFMHLTRLHVAEHLDGSEQDYRITFVRPPCNHVHLYRNCVRELDQLLKPYLCVCGRPSRRTRSSRTRSCGRSTASRRTRPLSRPLPSHGRTHRYAALDLISVPIIPHAGVMSRSLLPLCHGANVAMSGLRLMPRMMCCCEMSRRPRASRTRWCRTSWPRCPSPSGRTSTRPSSPYVCHACRCRP